MHSFALGGNQRERHRLFILGEFVYRSGQTQGLRISGAISKTQIKYLPLAGGGIKGHILPLS